MGNIRRVSDTCGSLTVIGDDSTTNVKRAEVIHEFYYYDNNTHTDQSLRRVSYVNFTGGISAASDKRFKSNIQPFQDKVLDKLMGVEIKTY